MSKQIVTTTPDVAGTEWRVPNTALTQQDRTLCSAKPSAHDQLAETPILRHPSESLSNPRVRSSQEEILHQPELPQPYNLVLDNGDVFLQQIVEPD